MSPKPDENALLLSARDDTGSQEPQTSSSRRRKRDREPSGSVISQSVRNSQKRTQEQAAHCLKTEPLEDAVRSACDNKQLMSDPSGLLNRHAVPLDKGATSTRQSSFNKQLPQQPESKTRQAAKASPAQEQKSTPKQLQEELPLASSHKRTTDVVKSVGGPSDPVTTGSETPTSENGPPVQRSSVPAPPKSIRHRLHQRELRRENGEKYRESAPAEMVKLPQNTDSNPPSQKNVEKPLQPTESALDGNGCTSMPPDSQPENNHAPPFRRGATATPLQPKHEPPGKNKTKLTLATKDGELKLVAEPTPKQKQQQQQQQQQQPSSPQPPPPQPPPQPQSQPPTQKEQQPNPGGKKASNNNSPATSNVSAMNRNSVNQPPTPQRPLPALPPDELSKRTSSTSQISPLDRQAAPKLPGHQMLHHLQLKSRLLHADILRHEADNYLPLPFSKKAAAAAGKKLQPNASPLMQPIGKPKPPGRSVAEMEAELFGLRKPSAVGRSSQIQQQQQRPLPDPPGPQPNAQPMPLAQQRIFSDEEGVYERPISFTKPDK